MGPRQTTLALGSACLALAACGSGSKTVSVHGEPPGAPAATSTASTAASTPRSAPSRRAPAAVPPPATSTGTTTTRSAPEPAFTEQAGKGSEVGAAAAVLRQHGYTPANTSDYHSGQALRVLIGVRAGSGDGYGQQAFFFVNGRYIGTDAAAPSAALRVVNQGDTEVTLGYPLYRKGDPLCCPSGGTRNVRFQLNNGRLTALDPIPPVSSASGFARQ